MVNELKSIGVNDVFYDNEHCYVYALLKANVEVMPTGFISHLDTFPDALGENIKPIITNNYDGKDIKLNNDITLQTKVYPDLKNHIGKTLITSDGTTLLGADDKAGITEIMNMLEYFCQTNENHGDIYVCFSPDEEIGNSVKYFDLSKFNTSYAYTVDGSFVGEISYENFNAAKAEIIIDGVSSHCGYAKGIMVNSLDLSCEIHSFIPNETPSNTEGHEGFYHLENQNGTVTKTTMSYLIRDFDKDNFEKRKIMIQEIVDRLNQKYNNCIHLKITDSYYNMKEKIKNDMHIIEIAKNSTKNVNVEPVITIARGGTDGAELSYKDILCPNLGTGGHNFHSIYEYIALEDMEKVSEILIEIVKSYAKEKGKIKSKNK